MYADLRNASRVPVRALLALAWAVAVSSPVMAMEAAGSDTVQEQAVGRSNPQPLELQHFRPNDARGLNVFEPPKEEGAPYTGFKLHWGGSFTQQFQALRHHNTADSNVVAGVDANELILIGSGFNNAVANLYLGAQLARGIRVELTSYLSSRHHNETWVKDGYLLIDGSPYQNRRLDDLMKVLTLRVGHFEINYGDQHFRRSDNGNAMFNPFVGNLVMDAFTTEIGAEAYFRKSGMLAMVGMTGGEIRGQVGRPQDRSPSKLGKLGFDREVAPQVRVRLTGSFYRSTKSINNTLYSGSRAGSRYYDMLENTKSTESAQAWSGDLQPGFRNRVNAWVVNPFVKFRMVELFGSIERAKGRAATESADRTWHQYAGDAVVRFLENQLFVGGRFNTAKGRLAGMSQDVSIDRTQVSAGWFVTKNLMAKTEYVSQVYRDFPATDIRNGGKFSGAMVEAVVSF